MNSKENYLNGLLRKPVEWVPVEGEGTLVLNTDIIQIEKGNFETGLDGFGVRWERPDSGGFGAIPAPGDFLLDSESIVDWPNVVKFPDPESYDWERDAAEYLEGLDRETMGVDYGDGNGPFERLSSLMGFEEALLAMVLEPEATLALLDAIADFKIACMELVVEHFHPDVYTLYDDVCTQKSAFMSPESYREMLLPPGKRIVEAARGYGMIPARHNCGYGHDLVQCFIDEGYEAWTSVQPCNDIPAILEKYGDKICIVGGYDTNGRPGMTDDRDIMQAEIQRCFDEYGKFPSYLFSGFIMRSAKDLKEGEGPWDLTAELCNMALEYSLKHKELRAG